MAFLSQSPHTFTLITIISQALILSKFYENTARTSIWQMRAVFPFVIQSNKQFSQCPYRPTALVHEDVKGAGGCGCADKHATLALVQWFGKSTLALVHHAIYDTVEKQLQRAGDISPITWCGNHYRIRILNQL